MFTAFFCGNFVSILPQAPPKSTKKHNKAYPILIWVLGALTQEPAMAAGITDHIWKWEDII